MKNKILLIVFALVISQVAMAQEKSNGSTRSNKQTVVTKDIDTTIAKTKANHNTTRSNKTIKEKDSINSKNKAQDHNSSRSNKSGIIAKEIDTVTTSNKTTKANINTSRSNIKSK